MQRLQLKGIQQTGLNCEIAYFSIYPHSVLCIVIQIQHVHKIDQPSLATNTG